MALEILEQGRAIFWTHTLRLRSPFDAVPEKNRSQLLLLARQLERTDPAAKDPRAVESEVTRRRKQSEQFNALLETIRRYPGMERFLLPDEYAKLATAAKEGPVVVLVSSALGCHAVVINSSGDVMGIPLKQPATGRGRPRVWWCPTGNFVHLPIHAAGADGDWATNYIVSSYTPTLGYLISAREACEPPKKSDILALLAAVPQPNTSQWHDLLFSREEVSIVSEILPAGMEIPVIPANCTLGKHENGITAERLLKNLPKATILHLACHAYQDPENALKSGFVMQDETLTIERLMQTPLSCAFMAFLSACETAKGDKDQPDQVVHLAATLLFAGFKTVIATLWSMEDVDGPLIAKSVYEDLFSRDAEYLNPDDIAYALDEAVLKLRLVHPEPSRWAPYIHLGI
ncbi:hypothetical protein PUNSTDRAFT_134957 [Punctularia strigosozonata HHB-11173 SS5]|uniref:uncharacterized protein n=1 Tax=Punctularia strigosozonata (strain HHB-11173) TaxID=741275 RepID=UPI0004416EFF|nr:uncharacterized protein PUNSTDRAFT_134957 [Punctularia strigosozonata HHB-11173 SS5]EIN08584.1 hypothetical protein PUNSTDRAFT_134957 [Punctularia strigosozonata HHB-11173 SS5]